MKFVAYYRVSTKKQGASGLGLGAQKNAVAQYIEGEGSLVSEFTEVETGTSKRKRVEIEKALAECKKHNATLVIAKLDRLARNVLFVTTIMESGVEFIACDVPSANRFTIQVLAAVAENEAMNGKERTLAGLGQIKRTIAEKGYYVSKAGNRITSLGTPGNFTDEGRKKGVEARKAKASNNRNSNLARPYVEELLKSGTSYREISNKLNVAGYLAPNGGEWFPMTVKRLIK